MKETKKKYGTMKTNLSLTIGAVILAWWSR